MVHGRIETTPEEQLVELRRAHERYVQLADRIKDDDDLEIDPEEREAREQDALRIAHAYERTIASTAARIESLEKARAAGSSFTGMGRVIGFGILLTAAAGTALLAFTRPDIFHFRSARPEAVAEAASPAAPSPADAKLASNSAAMPADAVVAKNAKPNTQASENQRAIAQSVKTERPATKPRNTAPRSNAARPAPAAIPRAVPPAPAAMRSPPLLTAPPAGARPEPSPPVVTARPAPQVAAAPQSRALPRTLPSVATAVAPPPVSAASQSNVLPPPFPVTTPAANAPQPSVSQAPLPPIPSTQPVQAVPPPQTARVVPAPPPRPVPPTPAPTPLEPIAGTHRPPPYPSLSLRLGEHGTTKMQVAISARGSVTACRILQSSGSRRLDTAACSYVRDNWKWRPPTRAGRPVAAETAISVVWNLRNLH